MLKPHPNYPIARRGLRAGGNHPADVEGMVWLFRGMLLVPAWQEALRVWADADREYEQNLPLKPRMQLRLAYGGLAADELLDWRNQLDRIHVPIVALEHDFARVIDVENAATLTALRSMGVDCVQGRGIAAEQPWSEAYRGMQAEAVDSGGSAAVIR